MFGRDEVELGFLGDMKGYESQKTVVGEGVHEKSSYVKRSYYDHDDEYGEEVVSLDFFWTMIKIMKEKRAKIVHLGFPIVDELLFHFTTIHVDENFIY